MSSLAEKTREGAASEQHSPPVDQPTPSVVVERSPVPKPVVVFFAGLRKIFGRAEDRREIVHDPECVSHHGSWQVRVAVEPDELDGGFVAECADVPGAMAQGETEEEALENLIDAINGVVRARMETHLRSLDLDLPPGKDGRVVEINF